MKQDDSFPATFPAPAWARIFPAGLGLLILAAPFFCFRIGLPYALLLAAVAIARWRLFSRWLPKLLADLLVGAILLAIALVAHESRIEIPIAMFIGFFTLGMWGGGAELIRLSIEGEEQRWTPGEGEIVIDRRNLLGEGRTIIRNTNLADASIHEDRDDDGVGRYCVALRLNSGESFKTNWFATRPAAEKFLGRLQQALSAG